MKQWSESSECELLRVGIVFGKNEEDINVTANRNEGQQGNPTFSPSPKWINEDRWHKKELHVDRKVPSWKHTLPRNIWKHYLILLKDKDFWIFESSTE